MSLTSKERQRLFLELACNPKGVTAQEVYEEGRKRGDEVSIEAYHNIGQRLRHNALVKSEKVSRERTLYFAQDMDENATWIDEDDLRSFSFVDPDYPLEAFAVLQESQQQFKRVPDEMWQEARDCLLQADARSLFVEAITAEVDDVQNEIKLLLEDQKLLNSGEFAVRRKIIDQKIKLMNRWCKHGLGLSRQAVSLPVSAEFALEMLQRNPDDNRYCKCDVAALTDEIARRIEPGMFIRPVEMPGIDLEMVVAGVDGATKGGLFSFEDSESTYRQPQVSINTAVGYLNRNIKVGKKPVFHRLPERPEDMQRDSNRYTIMAKLFYPDLTESQYMHSNWNALNLLQFQAMLDVMKTWVLDGRYEQAPADIVLRDGPVIPQDRDHYHYGQQDSYGIIVRKLIGLSRDIVTCCEKQGQTAMGVVRDSQMHVLVPAINYFLSHYCAHKSTKFKAWPKEEFSNFYDQALISRLLSAGRNPEDVPLRTALFLRPFHAASNILSETYSKEKEQQPADKLLKLKNDAQETFDKGEELLLTPEENWWRKLRDPGDAYLEMLRNVWYASFYLGSFPQGEQSISLPRFEFIVPHSTQETGDYPADICAKHLERGLKAIKTVGLELSISSSLFTASNKIDVLPFILVRARETAQDVATLLKNQVRDYVDNLRREKRLKIGNSLKPWPRKEYKEWAKSLQDVRRKKAGG